VSSERKSPSQAGIIVLGVMGFIHDQKRGPPSRMIEPLPVCTLAGGVEVLASVTQTVRFETGPRLPGIVSPRMTAAKSLQSIWLRWFQQMLWNWIVRILREDSFPLEDTVPLARPKTHEAVNEVGRDGSL